MKDATTGIVLGAKNSIYFTMLRVGLRASRVPHLRAPSAVPKAVISLAIGRCYSQSPFKVDYKKVQEEREKQKLPKYKQWALYFQTNEFKRSMTKYYLAMFGVMLVAMYYYMRDRWYEDQQIKHIRAKYIEDPGCLSEYEYLKLKKFTGDKLKPREEKKFKLYQMMRKEFRRKNIFDTTVMFEPTPADLDEWYSKQAKRTTKTAVADDDESLEERTKISNASNPGIVPPQDTTDFFDEKAEEYDRQIKWEERGVMMGRRRKWLMQQIEGDVLEVSCGTGRNIPYLNLDAIKSITFTDSSKKMVEETQKKFNNAFPNFKKVAYVTGKAEDLAHLAESNNVKYDTVVEAFGLCAHEDPVTALKNMAKLLRPGGRIVLLEHGRGTWDMVNNHLDFRAEKRMKTWGCRWNLDIGELIDDAGLDITYEKRVHLGSTWMLICKKPDDRLRVDEKPFINKLMGTEAPKIKKE